jgi:polyhydroxyalkanoate synthase
MNSFTSPGDPSEYFERLMQAGQQSMKQFDEALATTMGVSSKDPAPKGQGFSPFAFALDMQRQYLTQVWRFWNTAAIRTFSIGTKSEIQPVRGDKRFKDEAWQDAPYFDLLKQSYLLAARQLHDLVEGAQVVSKTKLQLRFYARQFIDALSPSNFPATNPEVIRTAIETRSTSLASGMANLIEDIRKGRITRVDESTFEVGGNLRTRPVQSSSKTN